MPTTSAVVATKQALVTLLAARPGLDGVDVEYSWREGLSAEHIVLRDVKDITHDPAGMRAGRLNRKERFTLTIYVVANVPGGTVEAAEARALAIAAEVEDAIADDKTVSPNDWATVESLELDSGVTGDPGAGASVTLNVRCTARLT